MTFACRHHITGVQEHLNNKIIQLGEKMVSLRNRNVETSSTFQQWQKKWSAENSHLKKQFANLEEKLANLTSTKKPTHKLSIYDVPPDSGGMTTMGPM